MFVTSNIWVYFWLKGEPYHSDTTEMWQHPPVTYEVNIHKKRKVTVQNVICTQGLSLIIVVLFSRYTNIETLFWFTSIIKKIIVCDRRYFEKPIDIVCWACMSSIQCGKVLCWPWSMIAYLTIQRLVQRPNRKALFFKHVQLERKSCV